MAKKKEEAVIDERDEKSPETEEQEVQDERDVKITELEEETLKLKQEIEAIKRAAADVINRSKQLEIDRKYASSELVRKLLVPLSFFEGALKYQTDDAGIKNFLKGFEMIYGLILDQLYNDGLKEIETKADDEYNPYLHEATEMIEVAEGEEKVVEIIQKGYYYKDRVIQPVKVKINKVVKSVEIENPETDNNEKVN